MASETNPCPIVARLRAVGLRPTRPRVGLGRLLFEGPPRHVSAEQLYQEARSRRLFVSLATVYNTLHQFAAAGLLRKVVVHTGQTFFDTRVCDHHHFYDERTGFIRDIDDSEIAFAKLPEAPPGYTITGVEVIVRVEAQTARPVDGSAAASRPGAEAEGSALPPTA
ncbi:MAG: Fur family transcriptional regulator [Geminicoccaceae bacterium]|nr:transcriptional repressor [Geminicoccaceae bacterium]MCS7268028.1 transcriptional repressor [Geminicoccaceae bacterium]MDW8124739.1 Fur family transcriptional regulator [Geminicoccaceae bacterium]MDW8341406.1 Fur family transcriptional regulator [Geminicoccaceae bacterium]